MACLFGSMCLSGLVISSLMSLTAAAISPGPSPPVFLFLLAFAKKGLCSRGTVGENAPLEVTPGGDPLPRASCLLPGSV